MQHSPATVAQYFVLNLRVERDRRDFDEELDGRTYTRPPFPCSESPGLFESVRSFRRESSGSEPDWAAVVDQACE